MSRHNPVEVGDYRNWDPVFVVLCIGVSIGCLALTAGAVWLAREAWLVLHRSFGG